MPIKILAVDTSTKYCSVALSINKKIKTLFTYEKNKHAEVILPMINKILLKNKIVLKKIDAIAYNSGPGSFTGIRIGVGIVQGLALGCNLPIISISKMNIIAQKVFRIKKKNKILVILHAFKKNFYCGKFQTKKFSICLKKNNEKLLKIEKVIELIQQLDNSWIIAGNISKINSYKIKKNYLSNIKSISAKDMIPIAIEKFKKGYIYNNIENIKIKYLHNKIIT